MTSTIPLLEVRDLTVLFSSHTKNQYIPAIQNIGFSLQQGQTLGIIGESGSGKSVTLLALLGLLNAQPGIVSGSILLSKKSGCINFLEDIENHISYDNFSLKTQHVSNWITKQERIYQRIRGKEISIIFQNPKLAFNPYYSIGSQISEMIRLHTETKDKVEAKALAINWLDQVKMDAPAIRYNNNPYGLSGGMCQRAMIAMALASNPSILIADEPTTGLDASIQSHIIELLLSIKRNLKLSMIIVSHDFDVMQQLSDKIIVYYKGRIIEEGITEVFFHESRQTIHPYTKMLLEANSSNIKIMPAAPTEEDHTVNGCDFFNLCQSKENSIINKCKNELPPLLDLNVHHRIRCWRFQYESNNE